MNPVCEKSPGNKVCAKGRDSPNSWNEGAM